jgi:hypothetical protein
MSARSTVVRITRARSVRAPLALMLGALGSCAHAPPAAAPPAPINVRLAVAAHPDSAVKLAKFAIGAIDGSVQLPKVLPTMTTVSTHYTRDGRRGRPTQIAVIAAVSRTVSDILSPVTIVQLSAWALETPEPLNWQPRRGMPVTPVTTGAASRPPRAITVADTSDWKLLEIVVEAFEKHGARRLP